jgi:hypothetical protein
LTELEQEPKTYVGVTEIAEILGVSRQRVAQLREREDFPWPIAEIAADPVWTRSSLNHLVAHGAARRGPLRLHARGVSGVHTRGRAPHLTQGEWAPALRRHLRDLWVRRRSSRC